MKTQYALTHTTYKSTYTCYSKAHDEVYACKASSFAEANECFERNKLDFDELLDLNTRLECVEVEISLPQDDGSLRTYKPRWVE